MYLGWPLSTNTCLRLLGVGSTGMCHHVQLGIQCYLIEVPHGIKKMGQNLGPNSPNKPYSATYPKQAKRAGPWAWLRESRPFPCQLPQEGELALVVLVGAGERAGWPTQLPPGPRFRPLSGPTPTEVSCRTKAVGSPWHRKTIEHSRGVPVRVQYWQWSRSQRP